MCLAIPLLIACLDADTPGAPEPLHAAALQHLLDVGPRYPGV